MSKLVRIIQKLQREASRRNRLTGPSERAYRTYPAFLPDGRGKQFAEFIRCKGHNGKRIGVYRTRIQDTRTGRWFSTDHYCELRGGRLVEVIPATQLN